MKRFPFTKRAIETRPPHDTDSSSREAEYTDMECIGLHRSRSKAKALMQRSEAERS